MKKKVLFLIDSLGGGGAEKVLLDLLDNIDKDKYDVELLVMAKLGELLGKIPEGVKYRFTFPNKYIFYAVILLPPSILYKLIVKDTYDTEVAFLEGRSTKVISGSNNKKSKKIAWVHIDLLNNHWTKVFFRTYRNEKKAYSKFDEIICVSEDVKNKFIEKFNIRKNVKFKQNPINDKIIKQKSNEKSKDIFNKDKFNLITVGSLKYQKGYDRLLKVVNELNKNNISFDLHIFGEGDEREKLESYIFENKLSNVKLHGFISNPYPYIKQADLFVCSSRTEGFSTVATESVILGTPIVTTDCSGMSELLGENSEYGYIVENTIEALFNGLKEILTNEELYNNYKKRVNERSQAFDLDEIMDKIEQIL